MDRFFLRILIVAVFYCSWCLPSVFASLRAPQSMQAADSASARFDQGVEYSRLTNFFSDHQKWEKGITSLVTGRWKSEWQNQKGSVDRLRQDGEWYAGISSPLIKKVQLWSAGQGEHFDDRPRDGSSKIMSSNESATAIRVLRGGAGLSYQPVQALTIHSGAGVVDDKRIGQHESGLGTWSSVELDHWMTGGYIHNGSLDYTNETPPNHHRLDLTGNYELFREFFPGNTNRTQLSAGMIERDVYRGSLLPSSRRSEQQIVFKDDLEYEIADQVSVSMSGDFQRETTDLGDESGNGSELEEQQVGIAVSLKGAYGKSAGAGSISVRSVSQTIRGEILNGRKTEASLLGSTVLPDHSALGLRLAVSKYVLDTRSERNFDDRDELGFRIESKWTKAFWGMVYEFRMLANLDHLVYIFEENSANNRWTRLFLLGSRIRHQPSHSFMQEFKFTVSANYQAYDFEFNPKSTRSTVFRRFIAGDSIVVHFTDALWLDSEVNFQIEELGRLYWEEFEEARSDETKSWYLAATLNRTLTSRFSAGAGYLWNRRFGDQFTNNGGNFRERFQDLNSYGPLLNFKYMPASGFFLSGSGRALQQFELNQEAKWIISGTVTGGVRW